jgi:hypothetical protein
MRIGPHEIGDGAALAPMAGVTNPPFRRLCRELGAAFAVTELVSCHAVLFLAAKEKNRSGRQDAGWRAAKLHTRRGMVACQGRTCGAAAKLLFGWGDESVHPPVFPVSIGVPIGAETVLGGEAASTRERTKA